VITRSSSQLSSLRAACAPDGTSEHSEGGSVSERPLEAADQRQIVAQSAVVQRKERIQEARWFRVMRVTYSPFLLPIPALYIAADDAS
jgi:hypothetical protein